MNIVRPSFRLGRTTIGEEMNNQRGVIITEHFPTCGKCGEGFSAYRNFPQTKHALIAQIREHGWKHSKKYGWVCPDCIAQ